MIQKSYKNNKSTLFLVSTPIGNLEDITFRAISVLKSVEVVFAEDTRITRNLLTNFNIHKRVYSCYKHNEKETTEKILNYLEKGKDVALLTDRGTPLISDPGGFSVREVINHKYNVVAIPGATAFVPALVTSGLIIDNFLFYGFLNHKENVRRKELKLLEKKDCVVVLYEAPHRFTKTLKNIHEVFGNRQIIISREITKYNEEIFRGTIEEAIKDYKTIKGEIVIIIEKRDSEYKINVEELKEDVRNLIKKGYTKTAAIKEVCKLYNVSKNQIYNSMQKEGE